MNFKISQEVICTKTLEGYVVKDKKYIIKDILVCRCGIVAIDYGQAFVGNARKWTCHKCNSIHTNHFFDDYYLCSTFFAPLIHSYNSATKDIIEKFKIMEEKCDVKPEIKIEEHEKV